VQWIALYAGDVELARATLTPMLTRPKVTFTVALDESVTLRALEQPNHSAAWEASKKITVSKDEKK
jgi:desulfoferrodoxin (superoxide reductase-like protein)